MTRWFVGTNNYYYEGSISLEEAPWYIFAIEYIMDIICHYFPQIPLPKIKIKRNGEIYTLNEYYGTTADLFHLYIHLPIFKWLYKNITNTHLRFPFQMLQEYFPDKISYTDFSDFEESVKEIDENKKYSEEVYEEFKLIYEKLNIYKMKNKK